MRWQAYGRYYGDADGTIHAEVRDPDGNTIDLYQRALQDWIGRCATSNQLYAEAFLDSGPQCRLQRLSIYCVTAELMAHGVIAAQPVEDFHSFISACIAQRSEAGVVALNVVHLLRYQMQRFLLVANRLRPETQRYGS